MHLILEQYSNKLQDFCQAEELQTLGCGVDTQRFATDESYRRDSILGLAMLVNNTAFYFIYFEYKLETILLYLSFKLGSGKLQFFSSPGTNIFI